MTNQITDTKLLENQILGNQIVLLPSTETFLITQVYLYSTQTIYIGEIFLAAALVLYYYLLHVLKKSKEKKLQF